MKYICRDCEREIDRKELEDSEKVRCPNCGSYRIRRLEE